jgi:hypothetical protein
MSGGPTRESEVRAVVGGYDRLAGQVQQPGHDSRHHVVMGRVAAGGQLGPPSDRDRPDPPVQCPRADQRPAQVSQV